MAKQLPQELSRPFLGAIAEACIPHLTALLLEYKVELLLYGYAKHPFSKGDAADFTHMHLMGGEL